MNLFDDHLDELTFTDYLDGALASEEREQVEAHLAVCVDCAAQIAEFRLLFTALDDLPDLAPSRDLAPAVIATVQPSLQPVYRPRPLRWVLALQSVAVVVLSLVAGYMLLPQWTALQQAAQVRWAQIDFTPIVVWSQNLWDAWVAPFQTWRGIDPTLFDILPVLPVTTTIALLVVTLIGWVICNRLLLPSVTLSQIPRRTP